MSNLPDTDKQTAKQRAEAFFLDLLSEPKAKPEKSVRKSSPKKTIDKSWGTSSLELIRRELLKPSKRIIHRTTQHCECGAEHTYVSTPQIRFDNPKRADKYAVETPFSLNSTEFLSLPLEIIDISEHVPVCPSCLANIQQIELKFEKVAQLSLFDSYQLAA